MSMTKNKKKKKHVHVLKKKKSIYIVAKHEIEQELRSAFHKIQVIHTPDIFWAPSMWQIPEGTRNSCLLCEQYTLVGTAVLGRGGEMVNKWNKQSKQYY